MSVHNKKILLVICGGISAYKALDLIRLLVKNNAEVKTILTKSGKQFVTPLSITSLSNNKVFELNNDGYNITAPATDQAKQFLN
jgi:phosphopantothenoylcysteine decarboxylase/phosphopantothenate--cysteine ligase